jgi:hypothetical protein
MVRTSEPTPPMTFLCFLLAAEQGKSLLEQSQSLCASEVFELDEIEVNLDVS